MCIILGYINNKEIFIKYLYYISEILISSLWEAENIFEQMEKYLFVRDMKNHFDFKI